MDKLKTREEVLAEFKRYGMTITGWAKENNLSFSVVRDVLRGRAQGLYGDSHKAAVLLGLKDGEIRRS